MKVNNNRATIIQWAVLNKKSKRLIQWVATFLLSSCLAIEKRLQRKLTQLPNVYHQDTRNNNELTSLLSAILLRRLRPSLFIGTRSILNTISVLLPRPSSSQRFREMITVSYDGAQIGLDWEIPIDDHETMKGVKDSIILKKGPIKYPVVLILHGVNNDTSLGYMRGVMHSCTEKGYIAAGMNYRGSGGTNLTTPRLHNAAYTNDLR
jgi:predicted alpha/beta-fold hydrolase